MISVTLKGNPVLDDCFIAVTVTEDGSVIEQTAIYVNTSAIGSMTLCEFKALLEVRNMHLEVCRTDVATILNDLCNELYDLPYIKGFIPC